LKQTYAEKLLSGDYITKGQLDKRLGWSARKRLALKIKKRGGGGWSQLPILYLLDDVIAAEEAGLIKMPSPEAVIRKMERAAKAAEREEAELALWRYEHEQKLKAQEERQRNAIRDCKRIKAFVASIPESLLEAEYDSAFAQAKAVDSKKSLRPMHPEKRTPTSLRNGIVTLCRTYGLCR